MTQNIQIKIFPEFFYLNSVSLKILIFFIAFGSI